MSPTFYLRHYSRCLLLAAAIALSVIFGARPSLAADITANANCPLSAAITAANNDSNSHDSDCTAGSGSDTITMTQNVTLSANLPQVTSTIRIEGGGYTIDGGDSHRLFYLNSSGNLTINNVTLTQGSTSLDGGGIYAFKAHVTVTNSTIRDSYAGRDGGGIYVAGAQATLTVSNSSITGNTGGQINGGITFAGASGTLTHVTLLDNVSNGSSSTIPSGLFNSSSGLKLRNSIVSSSDGNVDCFLSTGVSLSQNVGNLIEDNSCSPAASGNPSLSADGRGALLPGSGSPALGIGNSAVCTEYNRDQFAVRRPGSGCDAGAVERGGYNDIYVDSGVDNTGSPFPACNLREAITSANENSNANADGCVAGVADDVGTDVIWLQTDSTLSSQTPEITGKVYMEGGGKRIATTSGRIFSVASGGNFVLLDVELSGGSSNSDGGAMAVAGKLWLEDCVIKDNSTTSTADGGAISFSSGSNATIDRCAFINNRSAYQGGAIMIAGGSVNIRNSTFYKNHSANNGGAIAVTSGTVTLAQLTVWDNTSASASLVTGIVGVGTVNMYNSIIGRSATNGGALCGGTFDNSNTQRGIITWNGPASDNCGTVTVIDPALGAQTGSIPFLPLGAGSPAIGAGIDAQCANYPIDQAGKARPASDCDIGSVQYFALPLPVTSPAVPRTGGRGGGTGDYAAPQSASAPEPPVCTGEQLNETGVFKVSTTYGLCTGVQFNQLELSAIGIGYVVEAGPIAAVDVWGWVTATVEVCYRGRVSALFLDAAHSPRAVSQLASVWDGEWTCAQISRAGTIVLMPADSFLTTPPVDADTPESPPAATPLANCMARLDYMLNFRETPGGQVMMILPYSVKLTAFQRTADWVEVDWYGQRGWVSAAHVTFEGAC